ncbi:MAG TPA: hypothetical protein VLI68_04085 [Hanamia sp.]|nr:hypothetical protein [Hanamia sp.]
MISSIKTGFHHLWRHRLFTILNIFGLAISISVVWIIYGIVSYEFSYDKAYEEFEIRMSNLQCKSNIKKHLLCSKIISKPHGAIL